MDYELIKEAILLHQFLRRAYSGESVSAYIKRVHGLADYQRELLTKILKQIDAREDGRAA